MSNINEINYEELEAVTGGAYKPLPPKSGYVVYQIVRGDTLGRIAKAFNTTIKKIMAANPKICRHLHLPVQSGSDRVLAAMNRRYTAAEFRESVKKLRNYFDRPALTADLIAGFPGETEEDFQATLDMVREVRFASAFTFLYSRRTGTPAAKMPDQVPADVANERFQRLLKVVQDVGREESGKLAGKTLPVLVDDVNRQDKALVTGRLADNTVVHFPGSADLIGEIVPVFLRESKGFYYMGERR